MKKTVLKVWTGKIWEALYPETSADCVKMSDGQSVEDALKSIEPSSTPSASAMYDEINTNGEVGLIYGRSPAGKSLPFRVASSPEDFGTWAIPTYRGKSVTMNNADFIPSSVLWSGTPRYPGQVANKDYVDVTIAGTKLYKHRIILVGNEDRNGYDQRKVEYNITFTLITNDPFSYTLDDIMDRDFQNVIADVMYYDNEYYSNYFYAALPIYFATYGDSYAIDFAGSGCDDDINCFGISETVYLEQYTSPDGNFDTRVDLFLEDIVEEL